MKNWIFLLMTVLAFQACVDQQFDEPPFGEIAVETPEVTTTISELKAMHIFGTYVTIEEDIVIRGIIIADDKSGNLYKRLVIQDDSGGIELNINGVDLYNSLPEGREVFINCKDLVMGDFAGVIGLGGVVGETASGQPRLNGIEEILLDQYVTKGSTNQTITPTNKSISALNTSDISTLVQIDNLEFEDSELGKTYADFETNTNRFIQDCNGENILIRTSGFSNFYNQTLPDGNGTITAVFNVFNDTKQLLVRRPAELAFNGPRCDGSGSGGGGVDPTDLPDATTSIANLKASHTFGDYTVISEDIIIKGIVTADDDSGNFFKKIIVQDNSAGIELLVNERDLAANYGLQIGREIAILCSGLTLGDFAGNISLGGTTFINNSGEEQLGGIEPGDIKTTILVGEENMVVNPISISISDLGDDDIHRLVKLDGVQFADGSNNQTYADVVNNFSRNLDLEDCDGNTVVIRSSNFADFAEAFSPDGNGSIEAIYSVFNGTQQLFIRDLGDINMTGERCDGSGGGGNPGAGVFSLDFENESSGQLNIQGWTNFAEQGSLSNSWFVNDFDGNTFGEVTAYQSTDNNNISWLVTPGMDISATATISFIMAQHHWAQDGMTILISDNFTGDPTQSDWKEVNCTLPQESNDWYEWINSGIINLDDYFSTGTVHLAFKYEGNSNNATTSYRIDDVKATE